MLYDAEKGNNLILMRLTPVATLVSSRVWGQQVRLMIMLVFF